MTAAQDSSFEADSDRNPSVESIQDTLSILSSALHESHQLGRRKATEVLVWLLQDTDREWSPLPHVTISDKHLDTVYYQ